MRGLRLLPFLLAGLAAAETTGPLLLQQPVMNKTHLVFVYAGDLWSVPRAGGEAVRLTTNPGTESDPVLSPDGSLVAFTGTYDGNADVFTMPVTGGVPKRITWHPAPDTPVAFTPDGKQILFYSNRFTATRGAKLFTTPLDGGPAEEVPLPAAERASYSPDAKRLAYLPSAPVFGAWKRYRGGTTSKIWLANLADSRVEEIPRQNSNDLFPMWIGDRIYFLSDRNGPVTLFHFDPKTRKVTQAIDNKGLDYKWAAAGPGGIALERFGSIEIYDLQSGKVSPVEVRLAGDLPNVRPSVERVARYLQWAGISPTGARAVFQARGDVYTVPAEKGDVRNLTNTSGVAERHPSWSPDGRWIAYFSDESGEYQLHLKPQTGMGETKKFDLGRKGFFYGPKWSPDSKKIAFRTHLSGIALLDIDSGKVTDIGRDFYNMPYRQTVDYAWAPDSKWLAYAQILRNGQRGIIVYSLADNKSTQISDGLSDASLPQFDANGKYLYFTASTNVALGKGWLDMSSLQGNATQSVYLAVLSKDEPSPLAPESDEEKTEAEKKPDAPKPAEAAKPADGAKPAEGAKPEPKKDAVEVKIDFDGLSQRILALPIPARNFRDLMAGKTGILFLLEAPAPMAQQPGGTLHKFDLKTKKLDTFLQGVVGADISRNGEKILYAQGGGGGGPQGPPGGGAPPRWFIAGTNAAPRAGEGALRIDQMEARIDPTEEWKQIYREAFRLQRDFFYDPNAHGFNLADGEAKYRKYLPGIAHRDDLNYLFREAFGEMSVGHLYVGGGARPEIRTVPVGLLGCDYKIENGRYRFARIYNGENWNPNLRAPLTQPGVNVKEGDYLLAVNGRDVPGTSDVYSFFEATANKSVILKVGPTPDGANSREVTVVPVANEQQLRYMAWVEDNRRKVDQLSGGRLGYVHLPNTSVQGYVNFNRWYFAQTDKEGMVLDERFNGGGFVADYIVDYLRRPLLNYFALRDSPPFTTPMNVVPGPKVMIINEHAGSGGDAMPWMFRKLGIGPLIGKRTWGGLVGIGGTPAFIDNGSITAPNFAWFNLEKNWEIENVGVSPDIEVEMDPALVRQGRDPQLERAVTYLLDELKKKPLPKHEIPPYPNYHRTKPAATN
jgi:tricorn protease